MPATSKEYMRDYRARQRTAKVPEVVPRVEVSPVAGSSAEEGNWVLRGVVAARDEEIARLVEEVRQLKQVLAIRSGGLSPIVDARFNSRGSHAVPK